MRGVRVTVKGCKVREMNLVCHVLACSKWEVVGP